MNDKLLKKDCWIPAYNLQGFGLVWPEWMEKMRTAGRNA